MEIICFLTFLAFLVSFLICLFVIHKLKEMKIKKSIRPGAVLSPKKKNPFEDYEWKCETVTEACASDDGRIWIKSYTSNKDGVMSADQQFIRNKYGMRFFEDDWNIINQIDLEHEYNETR